MVKVAEEDYVDIAGLLLDKNADIEATNNKGRTALSFAAAPSMKGGEKRDTVCHVLRLLLSHGASLNHRDASGRTIKERAIHEKRQDAVEIIDAYEKGRPFELTAGSS